MADPRLAEYQLTREEAITFATERRWESMSPTERAVFQLRQDALCMDFAVFHESITELLGRPVYTHEFAKPDLLWDEYLGKTPKPDLAAILAKLPAHLSATVVVVGDSDG
jgi:hypothetical protein